MIKFSKYKPDNRISSYIDSYFTIATGIYNSAANVNGKQDYSLNNHPQGTIDLMFVVRGNGIQLSTLEKDDLELSEIFIMAQQEGVFEITFMPDTLIFGIVFPVESFYKFFNLPLSELTNSGAVIIDNLESDYVELFDRLKTVPTELDMVTISNLFLFNQLGKIDYEFTKFDSLVEYIRESHGVTSLDQLSSMANMSKRTLQRKMKDVTGVGPKSYSKTMRFRNVMKLIVNEPSNDWQDILFECNYYDQSHFIKDFKKFTGFTPSDFLKEQVTLSQFFEGE